jgi:hypothetical protein
MAYSESPVTVERMLPYLEPLLEGGSVAWNIEPVPGAAKKFAYKIREALFAAAVHSHTYPQLAELYGDSLEVRVVSSSRVEVIPAGRRPSIQRVEEESSTKRHAEVETRGVLSVEDVIARWEIGAESKLYFPKADFSPAQLEELWQWTTTHDVLFFENAGALTLMNFAEDVAEYAWKPEGGEDE